jgi:hypothetical protein
MSPGFVVAVFVVLMAALGLLVFWEFRRRPRGPRMSSQTFQNQLDEQVHEPYVAPREPRSRSMDRGPRT